MGGAEAARRAHASTSPAALTPPRRPPPLPSRAQIVMCEIDRRVCDVSKQFFGASMATAFSDPRLTLLYMDAAVYMKEHAGEFDVIIVDSSDPVGPAETLYTSDFYADMHAALRAGGIVCTQGECQWLHLDLIAKVMGDARALYPLVDYAYSGVPTYPNGQIGYILGCKAARGGAALRAATRAVPPAMRAALRYYSEEVHAAAFALPAFAAAKLTGVRAKQAPPAAGVSWPAAAAIAAAVAAVAVAVATAVKRK